MELLKKWAESIVEFIVSTATIRALNPTPTLVASEEKARNPTPFSSWQESPALDLRSQTKFNLNVQFYNNWK